MQTQSMIKELSAAKIQERIKNGAILIDVRDHEEVAKNAYDVPNIINIPLSQLAERFGEIPYDKELIMVCKKGGRSLRAAAFLVSHGYTDVVNLQKGIKEWTENGFPTKSSDLSLTD